MMKNPLLFLWMSFVATVLSAAECSALKKAYDAAEVSYKEGVRSQANGRDLYPLVNTAMDKAVAILAYCQDETSLSDQHLLHSRLRKLDAERSELASRAIAEFRVQYNIQPEITTIYGTTTFSTPSSKPMPPTILPMPPVIQPVLPPVLK